MKTTLIAALAALLSVLTYHYLTSDDRSSGLTRQIEEERRIQDSIMVRMEELSRRVETRERTIDSLKHVTSDNLRKTEEAVEGVEDWSDHDLVVFLVNWTY